MSTDTELAAATLDFLEIVYDLESTEDVWLGRVMDGICRIWGETPWSFALSYDASEVEALKVLALQTRELPAHLEVLVKPTWETSPPELIRRVYRSMSVGFGRSLGIIAPANEAAMRDGGAGDIFGLNGVDPEGVGCAVCLGTLVTSVEPERLQLYQRLAAHLGSAYRCRRRLRESRSSALEGAEAILDADARVLHAAEAAQANPAIESIVEAARAMQEARQASSMDSSVGWRPRVGARWTLVEAADSNGAPRLAARENQPAVRFLDVLTERERQVVASAAFGRTNKEIAYELGISHSTARVLLARACGRLGVRSRSELLALPAVRAMRGEAFDRRS